MPQFTPYILCNLFHVMFWVPFFCLSEQEMSKKLLNNTQIWQIAMTLEYNAQTDLDDTFNMNSKW